MQLLDSTLRLSTPLLFPMLGGLLSERAGIVNIALEGKLLGGAFCAMAAAHASGNPWVGVVAGAACGAAIGLAHAALVLRLKVDAILSGVGLNLLAAGLTTFLARVFFPPEVQVKGPAPWWPQLGGLPFVGTLLGAGSPLVPLALLSVVLVWLVLYGTRPGLQLRSIGENPAASRACGLGVERLQLLWLAAGGALAGTGGAYLSLVAAGRFVENLSAGRGYLAVAAVILGRWHPLGAAAAVLAFTLADALQAAAQGNPILGIQVPADLLGAMPYLLGLVALAGLLGRSKPPAALGRIT